MSTTSVYTRIFKTRNQAKDQENTIAQAKQKLELAVREYNNMTDQIQKAAKKQQIDAIRNFIVAQSDKFNNTKRELDCLQKRAESTSETLVADFSQNIR